MVFTQRRLWAVLLFAGLAALTSACKSKCSSLSDTCAKCIDSAQQEACRSVVNLGNEDTCVSAEVQYASVCK